MIHADELREGDGQIQFSLAALDAGKLRPKPRVMNKGVAVARGAVSPYEINLSGSQLLVWLMVGLCFVSLFAWGFVRHVVFAP